MGDLISGFSGFCSTEHLREREIDVTGYIQQTVSDELPVTQRTIQELERLGMVYTPTITRKPNYRIINNIFLLKTSQTFRNLQQKHNKNDQFKADLIPLDNHPGDIQTFIQNKETDVSNHLIGALLAHLKHNYNDSTVRTTNHALSFTSNPNSFKQEIKTHTPFN